MIVTDRCLPPGLPLTLAAAVRAEVHGALQQVTTSGSQFVVNDTAWLQFRASGKATPAVLNAANYISKSFQQRLKETPKPWTTEKKVNDQRIDAFKVFPVTYEGFFLDDEGLRKVVDEFWAHPEYFAELVRSNWPHAQKIELDQMVWWLSEMYFRRRLHDLTVFPACIRPYFRSTGMQDHKIRVAIEFETGNTASAYRAFVKLNSLYATNQIDLGIFVATTRAHAHRIWPVSNRNVNYEELANRGYRRSIYFPIWEISFEPDGYDQGASYLKANGTMYQPVATGTKVVHEGTVHPQYKVHGRMIIPL
jgi:hypothetical protein